MTEEMKKLRDKLAEGRAEKAFGEYSEIKNEEEINAFLAIVTDFRLGFDAGVAEMQAQNEILSKLRKADCMYINQLCEERDSLKAQLDVAVKALENIEGCMTSEIADKVVFEALTQIQKMRCSPSGTKYSEESK